MSLHYGETGSSPGVVQQQVEARAAELLQLLRPPQSNLQPCGISSTASTLTTTTFSTTTSSTTAMGTGYCLVSPAVSLNFSSATSLMVNSSSFSSQSAPTFSTSNLSSGSVVPTTTDITNEVLRIVLRVISSLYTSPDVPPPQSASNLPEPLSLSPPNIPVTVPATAANVQSAPAFTTVPSVSIQAVSAIPSLSSFPQDHRASLLSPDASQVQLYPLHQVQDQQVQQVPQIQQVQQKRSLHPQDSSGQENGLCSLPNL